MFFNDLDQTGWRLSLQESPKRIVSLVPSQTELLHNLGVMDYLVGRTKFCVHPNEIQTIPVVGGTKQINRERLLEVKPDLVIGNHEENTKEDIEWIRKSFPVWLSKVNSLKDAFSMIHSIGLLVNRLKEAQRITEKIKRVIPKKISSPKLSAAYLIWNKPMMVVAGNPLLTPCYKPLESKTFSQHGNDIPKSMMKQSGIPMQICYCFPVNPILSVKNTEMNFKNAFQKFGYVLSTEKCVPGMETVCSTA